MASKKGTTSKSGKRTRAKNAASGGSGRSSAIRNRKVQRTALITFVVAILLFVLLIVGEANTGVVGRPIKSLLTGLFGICKFFIPFVIGYTAVLVSGNTDAPVGRKIIGGIALIALICALVHLIVYSDPITADRLFSAEKMGEYYTAGWKSGGVIGALVGGLMMIAVGRVVSIIAIILLIATFILVISSVTLADIVSFIARSFSGAHEDGDAQEAQADAPAPLKPKKRFNPDVALEAPSEETSTRGKAAKAEKSKSGTESDPAPAFTGAAAQLLTEKPEVADSHIDEIIDKLEKEKEARAKKDLVEAALAAKQQEEAMHTAAMQTEELPHSDYVLPSVELLKEGEPQRSGSRGDLKDNAERLVETLKSFGVETRVLNVCVGPAVTRYELQPCAGVKISRITSLSDDIALNLAASGVRIEAPIPNKRAVGIEVPNKIINVVRLREVIDSQVFRDAESKLTVSLGRDITGNVMVTNLAKMPHLLIAGTTGSGKSVCINSFIISMLYKATPDEVKLIMIDPKMVELGMYNGIPHLYVPVVTDPRKAAGALNWAVGEMTRRYSMFLEHNVHDLEGYNEVAAKEEFSPMPQVVIIIDELADLMMTAPKEIEDSIIRLAQKARAAGMHLVVATQRPSVDVITGIIKANIPSRLAFAVSSQVDSRTILDGAGAEKLLGRGDMLFQPLDKPKPVRIQGCFVTEAEVKSVIDFVKQGGAAVYDDSIMSEIDKLAAKEKNAEKPQTDAPDSDSDRKFREAVECVIDAGQASTSHLQRKLGLGYARAARIMDEMEERGYIGPSEGSKPRKVLIDRRQWLELNALQNEVSSGTDNADFE